MKWDATGFIGVAAISVLLGCSSKDTTFSAGPPAPAPPVPPTTASVATPAAAAPVSTKPVLAASDGLLDAEVRDLIAREGVRTKCNDLNGCPMVDGLVQMGRRAAPAVESAFRASQGDAFWRFKLIEVLGRLGAPESQALLVALLKFETDVPARVEAALALGRGRYRGALTDLRGLATSEPLPPRAVLLAIGYAIGTLGDPLGAELVRLHLVVPEAPVVEAGVAMTPGAAIRQAQMGWEPLRPGIFAAGELRLVDLQDRLQLVAQRGDPFARRDAIRALGRLRERSVIPALILALEDSVPGNRKEALFALQDLTGFQHKVKAADWLRWWLDEGQKGR